MQVTHLWFNNWLCHRHMDEAVAPLTVVCGPNFSGKSAVLDGIAFALMGELRRVRLKGDRAQLLSDGAKTGTVRLSFTEGRIARDVATGKPASDNIFPPETPVTEALPFVLDRERFSRVDANDRRLLLQAVMGVDLGPDGLLATLAERGHSGDLLSKLTPGAAVSDWLEQAERGASEARGAWKAIAGSVYGSEKAKTWQASGPADPPTEEEVLAASTSLNRVSDKVEAVQMAIGAEKEHVAQAEREQAQIATWRKLAATVADEKAKLEGVDAELREALAKVDETAAEVRAADDRAGASGIILTCPKCQTPLGLQGKHLVIVDHANLAQPDLAAVLKSRRDADEAARVLTTRRDAVLKRWAAAAAAEASLAAATMSREREPNVALQEMQRQLAILHADRQSAIALSNRVTIDFLDGKRARHRTREAEMYHESVQAWVALRDALQPDGVPGELLTTALRPFNDSLRTMAADTGWAQVTLTPDMDVLYGNRPHGLLSRSERWRADAMVSVALAMHSSLGIVGLDEFDVLDVASRGQAMGWLYGLTHSALETVIVLATLKTAPPVPSDAGVIWLGTPSDAPPPPPPSA